jgi:hypothetical protein
VSSKSRFECPPKSRWRRHPQCVLQEQIVECPPQSRWQRHPQCVLQEQIGVSSQEQMAAAPQPISSRSVGARIGNVFHKRKYEEEEEEEEEEEANSQNAKAARCWLSTFKYYYQQSNLSILPHTNNCYIYKTVRQAMMIPLNVVGRCKVYTTITSTGLRVRLCIRFRVRFHVYGGAQYNVGYVCLKHYVFVRLQLESDRSYVKSYSRRQDPIRALLSVLILT